MKKIVKLAALLILVVATSGTVSAQKIAHINLNDLLLLLPERKKAETDIQDYAKQLDGQLKTMSNEYDSKIADYQAKESIMTEPVKADKQKEIGDLEERIKAFQQTAQESLQKKQNDLLEPMIEKSKKAIEEVAKENGYKNCIDSSAGVLLYSDPADDIMALVKKKLSITDAANPAANDKKEETKTPEKKSSK
jgi:outer membrane protein